MKQPKNNLYQYIGFCIHALQQLSSKEFVTTGKHGHDPSVVKLNLPRKTNIPDCVGGFVSALSPC